MDSYINHNRILLHHFSCHKLWPPYRHNENLGLTTDRIEFAGFAVAERYRCVATYSAIAEHTCNRFPYNVATADHDNVATCRLDLLPNQKLLNSLRRTGKKSRLALNQPTYIFWMEGIHIFCRVDCLQNFCGRHLGW